jgi:REP-associated tyrosine transposase
MPNYRRFYLSSTPVFITVVTQGRKRWLTHHTDLILHSMKSVKQYHSFRHIAHVILPDHIHWIFEPKNKKDFSIIMAAFKRDVTWSLKSVAINEKWQKRFYDHVIRDDEDLKRHLDYIHYNPVKHGLVEDPFEYQYSSIHEWKKRGVYLNGWGAVEPDNLKDMNLE